MSDREKKKEEANITYRRAVNSDLDNIKYFVDYWLAGRAKNAGVENAGNDYFVTSGQHKGYLKGSIILLALINDKIVGWAVKGTNNVLIHLLIAADTRGMGIGSAMLKQLNPDIIRSKSDQQTGDPASFYEKHGYALFSSTVSKIGKKSNIDLMVKNRTKK